MGIYCLKIFLLVVISGVFFLGAILTYKVHPEEVPLWIALSCFGCVSLFLSAVLSFRLYAMLKEARDDEK